MMVFIFTLLGILQADSIEKLYFEANEAFSSQKFQVAASKYQAIVDGDVQSPVIFYNLANSYFRNQQLGKSIFYFLKANELSPRDPEIRFNLAYALAQRKDQVESDQNLWWSQLSSSLSLSELYYLMTVLVIVFLVMRALFDLWGWSLGRSLSFFVLVVTALVVAQIVTREVYTNPIGVVIAETAKVYSGAGKKNILLFSLNEGTEFTVVEQGEWLRILLADGKQGWISSKNVIF